MGRVNAPILALNRGEISKTALARVDLAKLQFAAECQLNWEPKVLGTMMLRPGLQEIGETASDSPATLIDFVYAKTDTSLIELTPNKMRVRINDALLSRVSVSTAISDPNFAGGGTWTSGSTDGATTSIAGGTLALICAPLGGVARAKQTITVAGGDQGKEHGLRITVTSGPVTIRIGTTDGLSDVLAQTAIDTGIHSIPFTPAVGTIYLQIDSTDQWTKTLTQCTIEAAGTVEITTTWGLSDLANLRWTQSQDIVYVACYGQQQRKIERRGTRPGARGWSFVLYRSGDGPFHSGPDSPVQLKPNGLRGSATVTASGPFFDPSHVGALLRMFTPGQSNLTLIGAANQFTIPTRISGIQGDRIVGVTVTGTWTGTVSLQRSLVSSNDGFVTIGSGDAGWASVPTLTGNFSINYLDDKTTAAGNIFDNVIAWYRLGFESGNYTSGSASMAVTTGAGGGFGIARITGYSSPTSVNVDVLDPFTNIVFASNWQISDWCSAFGWPTSAAFHEGRLGWFSGGTIPIALSRSDNYYSYAQSDRDANALGDSGAILEVFGEGPSDAVSWGLPLTRLLCGRDGSVASIRSSSFDEPLTPTNFSVKDCTTQGAARLPAVKVDKRGIYVQQSGRRVYDLELNAQVMDYGDSDLTRLNIDIGLPGFVSIAVARQPDTAIYFVRSDGQCAVLLYDPADEVVGWWRIQTLGIIEQVRVLPAPSGPEDYVYFVVKRTVNGVVRRFIERLALRDNCAGGLLNQLLDCHATYQGAPVSTITLSHLPSTSVQIWADGVALGAVTTDGSGIATLPNGAAASNIVAGLAGSVQTYSGATTSTFTGLSAFNGLTAEVFADQQPSGRMIRAGVFTVSGGTITLPANWQAANIVAFFGYQAPFMSAKLAYAAQGGTALNQTKRISAVGLVLYDTHTLGIQIGQLFDHLDPLPGTEDGAVVPANTVWSAYDEPVISVPGEWDTDSRLCMLGAAPYPCKVGGVVVAQQTNES